MFKLIFIFCLSFSVQAELITSKNIIKSHSSTRTITTVFHPAKMDEKFNQVNPFVLNPYSEISDVFTNGNTVVYSQVYHTGEYGLRQTLPFHQHVKGHILFAGDSNMFGIGVSDVETTPSQFSRKVPEWHVSNLGMAGVGPNSTLYFFQNFSMEKVIGSSKKGIFVYDFHHHLFDRVIGSKLFLSWSKSSPRYELETGQLLYKGTLEDKWMSQFYSFLNKLPFNETLFPNLPRINHDHIELTAKILAEIKHEYLRQTESGNLFIVAFNPVFEEPKFRKHLDDLQLCLKKEGVETIVFSKEEMQSLPRIEGEIHMSAVAHAHYAEMLFKKLSARL
jgi:hypothetical protein